MEAYLDNSATTRVFPEVVNLMVKTMSEDYGNPSSMHTKGVEAEQYIKEATKTFAQILKVPEKEIYYTSGGTESDNWALIGTAMDRKSHRGYGHGTPGSRCSGRFSGKTGLCRDKASCK